MERTGSFAWRIRALLLLVAIGWIGWATAETAFPFAIVPAHVLPAYLMLLPLATTQRLWLLTTMAVTACGGR